MKQEQHPPVRYRHRPSGEIREEVIEAERALRWVYEHPVGSAIFNLVLKHRPFSEVLGWSKDAPWSRREIIPFAQRLGIDLDESIKPVEDFTSFNDFFARRLKPEVRPWDMTPDHLPACAEGRILVYPRLQGKTLLPIKGQAIPLDELLRDRELADRYRDGSAVIFRLCPADYHVFHFPDGGMPSSVRRIAGHYHSVNPIALAKAKQVFCRNTRHVTRFDSDNFGPLAMVEVGAFGVGRIVQTFYPHERVERQAEKGFFKFGGSTTLLLFERDRVVFDEDLVKDSAQGLETIVKVGEGIGSRP